MRDGQAGEGCNSIPITLVGTVLHFPSFTGEYVLAVAVRRLC